MSEKETTLEEAILMAARLNPAELMKLRRAIDQMTAEVTEEDKSRRNYIDTDRANIDQMTAEVTEEDREIIFKRVLLRKGLISEVRPQHSMASGKKQPPISVKGKPVSETIIEERG